MKLTGFADEIAADLTRQLEVLRQEEIRYLEFRSVDGINVLQLSDEHLQLVKAELERNGVRVSAIGSPIGKIGIQDEMEPHLLAFDRAIAVAKLFGTAHIRLFSFFIPRGDDPGIYRDEVMLRMKLLVRRAEEADVLLLLENETGTYADTPERCLDVIEHCGSSCLRHAFDPGNYIQSGVASTMAAYRLLEGYVAYMHVKDVSSRTGKETPAGQGDGRLPELIGSLQQRGYDGFLSLEPHLASTGQYPNESSEELFVRASRALKSILDRAGQAWT
ncbi:sugar phosphate isomerase/epimerase family protein [Paenibacillus montanisoli]|uniref:Sugar phosphate isomerase/epimerase n=1 Tax=Paenibacillus montanisoli TaxID=2081970 RepID=A0A328TX47_9BACL|nr:sugar phosphate isomerase/epimerase family protein [Paenibacillus montanisoli]RAP75049.1 sugar phosphate isomerase/epimerase [Paenibacillus montanisoli]